jgi:hypothetical protein
MTSYGVTPDKLTRIYATRAPQPIIIDGDLNGRMA